MIRTTQELIESLKCPETNVLFVIGPYIGDYKLFTAEEADSFKLRGIAENAQAFYDTLSNKILTSCDDLKRVLKAFHPFVNKYYAQTVNGVLEEGFGAEIHYLKGNAERLECTGCHQSYSLADAPKNLECTCGRLIRPKCLLTSERYDMEKIQAFEEDLKNASIVFLIGFDFNEIELCKQLEVMAAEKMSNTRFEPVVVVVGECDKQSVYDTFYPEFIVDEKPESALERLWSSCGETL